MVMRMRRHMRGVTLIELLIFSVVMMTVSAFVMRALGQGRMVRANARDRLTMLTIAQGELDQLRLSAHALRASQKIYSNPSWPSETSATLTIKPGPARTWDVQIEMTRQSVGGKPKVRLATLVAATTETLGNRGVANTAGMAEARSEKPR